MEKELFDRELIIIFEDELNIYLSLEKSLHEFMEAYRIDPTEELKKIILNVINNTMEQNTKLLELVSKFYSGVEKVKYSNLLGKQLNDLHDYENEIKNASKSK